MSILKQFKRLQFIDFIIKKKATGTPETFAQKNNLSKRGLAVILAEMKEMGFPVKYSKALNSYYYEEDGEMVKCLFIKAGQVLSRKELSEIKSGDAKNLCFSKVTVFEVCNKV